MSATAIDEAPVEAPGHEELPIPEHLRSAWRVLIAGLRLSPELRRGLVLTVVVSLGAIVGNLVVPILVQQIFDHGF
jgi:ATP-binding cassette, subfamily B, bacterial